MYKVNAPRTFVVIIGLELVSFVKNGKMFSSGVMTGLW